MYFFQVVTARKVAISALFDIIKVVLKYMKSSEFQLEVVQNYGDEVTPIQNSSKSLSDDLLFNWVLPPLEMTFTGRVFYRFL